MGLIVHNVTRPFFPDTTPPTAPVLGVPSVTGNSVTLSWSAATDVESGVVGYVVIIDGNPQPNLVKALSVVISGLQQGSHTFQVAARDGSGNVSVASNSRSAQIGVIITNGVKFHPGHGPQFDNVFWSNNGSAQKTAFNAHISALAADPTITVIELWLTWAQMEPTQGDRTAVKAIIDSWLAKLKSFPRPLYLGFNTYFLRAFNHLATDTSIWPPWVISNGWTINNNNQGGSQLTFAAPCVAAYTKLFQDLGDLYDGDPNFEYVSLHDETDMVTGGSFIGSASYYAILKQQMLDIKPHWPHTSYRIPGNWLTSDSGGLTDVQKFDDLISTARAHFPGGVCWGGPDPSLRNTTFDKLFRGETGSLGDLRGVLPRFVHSEETWEGTAGPPVKAPTWTVKQVFADAIDVNKAHYMISNYETWMTLKWADMLTEIHARAGVTNSAPSEGSFDTTPGEHA